MIAQRPLADRRDVLYVDQQELVQPIERIQSRVVPIDGWIVGDCAHALYPLDALEMIGVHRRQRQGVVQNHHDGAQGECRRHEVLRMPPLSLDGGTKEARP